MVVIFAIAGLLLALAWHQFGWPPWPALAAFGLALITGGLAVIARRELVFMIWRPATQQPGGLPRRHRGTAAVLFGSTFVLPGLALLAIGAAGLLGHIEKIESMVLTQPGVVLLGIALCLALLGSGLVISRWTYVDHVPTAGWQRLPSRLLGVYFLVLALLLCVIGAVAVSHNDDWPGLMTRLIRWVEAMLAR